MIEELLQMYIFFYNCNINIYLDKFPGINLKLQLTVVTVSFQNCYLPIQLVDFNGRIYPLKHMAGIYKAAAHISNWESPAHL